MTREEFIVKEINRFFNSKKRKCMIDGERYFEFDHDILSYRRMVVGEDGNLVELENLPNNQLIDNQYEKAVVQKTNYLCGKPVTISTDNKVYYKELIKIFNKDFNRRLKNISNDSLNCGLGWMYLHYDEEGQFKIKKFKPYEVIPGWRDQEHTELDYAIRVYTVDLIEDGEEKKIRKIEYYTLQGIYYYEESSKKNELLPCQPYFTPYFKAISGDGREASFNWSKIPLIAFKCGENEIPLISKVKCLQDALNLILSVFQNNMEEDVRDTIFILLNYDGENMAGFRKNLAQYGVVPLTTVDGVPGDLKSLKIEVNSENYKTMLDILRRSIVENAKSYDAKDERFGNAPNQMNIKSMYNDVDIDANTMETEFQSSFEELLWFINNHLANSGKGDFSNESVDFIFNRSILINESEIIDNVIKSINVISDETALAKHPWVKDAKAEIDKMKEAGEEFGFNPEVGSPNEDEEEE